MITSIYIFVWVYLLLDNTPQRCYPSYHPMPPVSSYFQFYLHYCHPLHGAILLDSIPLLIPHVCCCSCHLHDLVHGCVSEKSWMWSCKHLLQVFFFWSFFLVVEKRTKEWRKKWGLWLLVTSLCSREEKYAFNFLKAQANLICVNYLFC